MTISKRIGNKTERVLWIPVSELNGPPAEAQQQKMEFTPVDDVDLPDEFKD